MMATCVPTIFPPIVTRQTSRRTVNHTGQKIGQKRRGVGLRQGQPNLSDLDEIQPFFVLPVPMRDMGKGHLSFLQTRENCQSESILSMSIASSGRFLLLFILPVCFIPSHQPSVISHVLGISKFKNAHNGDPCDP